MIQRFLDYIAIEKRYSPRTVKEYGDDLRAWCAFLGCEMECFDPNPLDAEDVKAWMLENLHRINVYIKADKAKTELVEAVLHYAFRPRYEGNI